MTMKPPLYSDEEAFDLLNQLEHILDHDPLIDEVGFIHPSQLVILNEEADAASISLERQEGGARLSSEISGPRVESKNAFFWSSDHKLGISTACLLALYKAAKHKFMKAFVTYQKLSGYSVSNENVPRSFAMSEVANEVMKHSKVLLLLSSDFGTAWNARKLIISKRDGFSISDELLVSALVLSFAPKSESAWTYRRWVIKRIAGNCATLKDILENESKLVEKIAENSKMNYRAWNHRCWSVSYMTSQQVLREFHATRNWTSLHVADSSCFHYRRKLMSRLLDDVSHKKDVGACSSQIEPLGQLWKDELECNEALIRRYIGREALWLHRRYLSVCWVKFFGADQSSSPQNSYEKGDSNNDVSLFVDNELCLLQDCLNIPKSEFEDVQSQAIHSASYILWLYRELYCPSNINFNQKLGADELRTLLNKLCPEKTKVWDSFLSNLSTLQATTNL